jgi:UDP-3-O-[3-hydroxymyristoyl] glucosamine N-acyltransferase
MFAGQVGVAGHLTVADDVTVLGQSLVASSITEAGTYSSAIPAERTESWRRRVVRQKQLEEMVQRVRQLEQEIQDLKGKRT